MRCTPQRVTCSIHEMACSSRSRSTPAAWRSRGSQSPSLPLRATTTATRSSRFPQVFSCTVCRAARSRLDWYDRSGKRLAWIPEGNDASGPALAPDEKRLAVSRLDATTRAGDIWLFELTRNSLARLTLHPAYDFVQVWSPDGERIVFASNRNSPLDLYQKLANGTGPEELLLQSAERKAPTDWSSTVSSSSMKTKPQRQSSISGSCGCPIGGPFPFCKPS